MLPANSKYMRFEKRYPRETVEQVKALLREFIGIDGPPMPSYRAIARYLCEFCDVSISGTTVKRIMDRLQRQV